MNCELCTKEHDGTYGSGRFCCQRCARSYVTHNRRDEINQKISEGVLHHLSIHKRRPINAWTPESLRKANETRKRRREERLLNTHENDLSKDQKRKRILERQKFKCLHCGIEDWNGRKLTLQLDHINGDRRNYDMNNLRYLCPNCHSQTDTWGFKGSRRRPIHSPVV